MAKNGTTVKAVTTKSGKQRKFACPMTRDEYIAKARRDVVVTPGINPAYVAWVSKNA